MELFEARSPRGRSQITHLSGVVGLEETDTGIVITVDGGSEDRPYEVTVPRWARLRVAERQSVRVGERLSDGSIDPHEMLEVLGATCRCSTGRYRPAR